MLAEWYYSTDERTHDFGIPSKQSQSLCRAGDTGPRPAGNRSERAGVLRHRSDQTDRHERRDVRLLSDLLVLQELEVRQPAHGPRLECPDPGALLPMDCLLSVQTHDQGGT